MKSQQLLRALALASLLSAVGQAAGSDPILTTIDIPGATSSSAWGINSYRDVVGVYTLPDKTNHGFVLRAGKITKIDVPGAVTTETYGINIKGDIVGDYIVDGTMHGFLLSEAKITTIDFPGAISTAFAAISTKGDIVVAYVMPDKSNHAAIYSNGNFTNIDFPGATSSIGNGINARGDVVANYSLNGVTHGYLVTNGVFKSIDHPDAAFTGTYGIDSAGNIVGRFRDTAGVTHGFLFSDGNFTSIDIPGATFTGGAGINPRGDIVGRYVSNGISHGFLLAKPPVRYNITDLGTLPGGKFSQANAINDDGVISGLATIAGGTQHAVLWQNGAIYDIARTNNSGAFGANRWGQEIVQGEGTTKDPNRENFCGYGTGLNCLPYLWQGGKWQQLPLLGGNNGTVGMINNRGEAVGVVENATRDPECPTSPAITGTGPQVLDFAAVIWGPLQGEIRELRPLRGDKVSIALGLNDHGQVVGASGSCGNTLLPPLVVAPHAVLWEKDGSVHNLGTLGGTVDTSIGVGSTALSINSSGKITGASAVTGNKTNHAFLWMRQTGMRDLGALPGDDLSVGLAINEQDTVVGASFDAEGNPRGYVWADGTMTDFNTLIPADSPLYVLFATAINNHGKIVGYGATETGDIHAFVATPLEDNGVHALANSPMVWPKSVWPKSVWPKSPFVGEKAGKARQR